MQAPFRAVLVRLNRIVDYFTNPRFLAAVFLFCALLTGLGCALLTPVGEFSDEGAHFARTDGLSHGEIFGRKEPSGFPGYTLNAGVMIDKGGVALLLSKEAQDAFPDKPVPSADRRAAEALPWSSGLAYCPTQMVEYFPIMYVPGTLGILAGRAGGLTLLHTFYLGRVAMLLAFIALGTASIRLARFGNGLIFATLTLPTTINLASSYNEDGLIIACCALAAALLSRCRPGLSRDWFAALVLLTAVVSAKTPYAGLLLLCLPPLLAPGLWRRAAFIGLACLLPGMWLLHTVHFGFMPYLRTPYHPGPLWPGSHDVMMQTCVPADNLRVLLTHPVQIILLPLASFALNWHETWPLLLGVISWDYLRIAAWEYPCLAVALLAAACAALYNRPGTWRWLDAGFGATTLFAAFIGVELSVYLTWNNVGAAYITGVNSRYFTPLIPFFIFLLPSAGRVLGRMPGAGLARLPAGWLYLPAVAMALVNIYALPAFIFHVFRMPGP
jgi:hypothetical protein